MDIEFALLWEDHTWSTEVFDVPFTEEDQLAEIEAWVRCEYIDHPEYRKAVLITVYNDAP